MLMQLSALLLPVAASCGWLMGRKERKQKQLVQPEQLRHDYFKGLNY